MRRFIHHMRHVRHMGLAGALGCVTCISRSAIGAQVVVTDVSYTHSAANTADSHYFVPPSPATPADWTSPVDYTKGSVYVRLEVKTKPGDTPTRYQICFDVLPEYGCTWQVEPYTAPGVYSFTMPFSDLWYPTTEHDWTRGIRIVSLILKDVDNGKPQGDPRYVPTDLRVTVALLSEGAAFVPPVDGGAQPVDAAAREAGGAEGGATRDAGVTDASLDAAPPTGPLDSSVDPPDRNEGGPPSGGGGAPSRPPPSRSGGAGGRGPVGMPPEDPDTLEGLEIGGRGCAAHGGSSESAARGALLSAVAALLVVRRRRQRDARSRSSAA